MRGEKRRERSRERRREKEMMMEEGAVGIVHEYVDVFVCMCIKERETHSG